MHWGEVRGTSQPQSGAWSLGWPARAEREVPGECGERALLGTRAFW